MMRHLVRVPMSLCTATGSDKMTCFPMAMLDIRWHNEAELPRDALPRGRGNAPLPQLRCPLTQILQITTALVLSIDAMAFPSDISQNCRTCSCLRN